MHPSPEGGQLSVRTSEIGGLELGRWMVDQVIPPSCVDSMVGSLYAPAGLWVSYLDIATQQSVAFAHETPVGMFSHPAEGPSTSQLSPASDVVAISYGALDGPETGTSVQCFASPQEA